jgi:hypothetical protein
VTEDSDYDPIVEEVRKAREEYAAQFDFDLNAMITDLQRRTELHRLAGHPVIPVSPAPPWTTVHKVG